MSCGLRLFKRQPFLCVKEKIFPPFVRVPPISIVYIYDARQKPIQPVPKERMQRRRAKVRSGVSRNPSRQIRIIFSYRQIEKPSLDETAFRDRFAVKRYYLASGRFVDIY